MCELNKDHPQADKLFNPERLPGLHDPFSGGGTIPLEAQRLGLQACASDLNPVAVLLSKAMIEIPPRFAESVPVGPLPTDGRATRLDLPKVWPGAAGLAEDVRRYGAWMLTEAKKRIGHLYPKYEITGEIARELPNLKPYGGQKLTIIASLWARTVKSPNPAFSHVDVPLVSTFIVSDKRGNQTYIQPIVKGDSYHFSVKVGQPPPEAKGGTSAGRRAAFNCLISGSPIDYNYIRAEGRAGRLRQKLMAVVAEGPKGRIYLSPTPEMEAAAATAAPTWKPSCEMPKKHRNFQPPAYGMTDLGDLFTSRQLVALTTFSELVEEARDLAKRDALVAGLSNDETPLVEGGLGATAYSQALSVYLGCALSRLASYNNTVCHWNVRGGSVGGIFSRHAIPMSWDYIEVNPLEKMSGNWVGGIEWVSDVLTELLPGRAGSAQQADAGSQALSRGKIISTDPPYYDNISYADLSDFFYVWLRPSLRSVFPDLFATVAVPKAEELVAAPLRHGSRENAEAFFLAGMTEAMHRLAEQAHPGFPVTIYYAFKQSQTDGDEGTTSTGWDTFLDALIRSGFAVTGTWPMRTERTGRPTDIDTNALASSIVLVCRKRHAETPAISRREFLRELNAMLPEALDEMTKGSGDDVHPLPLSICRRPSSAPAWRYFPNTLRCWRLTAHQ